MMFLFWYNKWLGLQCLNKNKHGKQPEHLPAKLFEEQF